jgi:hypothetical protein
LVLIKSIVTQSIAFKTTSYNTKSAKQSGLEPETLAHAVVTLSEVTVAKKKKGRRRKTWIQAP